MAYGLTYLLLDWTIKDRSGVFLCEGGDERKLVRRYELGNCRCSELAVCLMRGTLITHSTAKRCVEMERNICAGRWSGLEMKIPYTVSFSSSFLSKTRDGRSALGSMWKSLATSGVVVW
jgi:hypothetical protein